VTFLVGRVERKVANIFRQIRRSNIMMMSSTEMDGYRFQMSHKQTLCRAKGTLEFAGAQFATFHT
jgi:hypothetical protein